GPAGKPADRGDGGFAVNGGNGQVLVGSTAKVAPVVTRDQAREPWPVTSVPQTGQGGLDQRLVLGNVRPVLEGHVGKLLNGLGQPGLAGQTGRPPEIFHGPKRDGWVQAEQAGEFRRDHAEVLEDADTLFLPA